VSGRLDGRVAIVTGAARGQGAAEAALFAAEGATVVMGDVLVDELAATAHDIGPAAHPVRLDVTSPDDWSAAVATAAGLGPLRVLVNNAAIHWTRPLEEESPDGFRRMFEVNLLGAANGMQAVFGPMRGAGGGSIVNVSSTAGIIGIPRHAAYGSSKWALRGLTRTAAAEWGRHGIRVNSIHPGAVNTDMLPPHPGAADGARDDRFDHLPLGRAGEADEVARLALFLASDESSFSTGAEFVVDGGSTAGLPGGSP
jgi:3alpha(or 20beta)-hydroxysteroid dehydrogenase